MYLVRPATILVFCSYVNDDIHRLHGRMRMSCLPLVATGFSQGRFKDHPSVWWLKFCQKEPWLQGFMNHQLSQELVESTWFNTIYRSLVRMFAMFVKYFLFYGWTLVIVSWWDSLRFQDWFLSQNRTKDMKGPLQDPPLSFMVTPPNKHV